MSKGNESFGKVLQSRSGEFCIIPENIFEEFKVKSEMTAPLQAQFESDVEGQSMVGDKFVSSGEMRPDPDGYFPYDQPWVCGGEKRDRYRFEKFRF